MPRTARPKPSTITSPFTVIVDSREGLPYAFDSLRADADRGSLPLVVPTVRRAMPTGDYGIFGHPHIVIERKSKPDLYSSVALKRQNFVDRLGRMSSLCWAAVVVEATWDELVYSPPRHTKYPPKSLYRTVLAWMQRYPTVHWVMCPGREFAEITTYRLLERWWLDHTGRDARSTMPTDPTSSVPGY